MNASLSRCRLSAMGAALGAAALVVTAMQPAPARAGAEALREGFTAPPAEARPWTWFHVMSGNMSREGITKDLESLAEVGVGGIVLFHVTQGIAHGKVRFNSPEHLDLIAHTAAECERLGLKFHFHNADGWSSTGGPWVTPQNSMKRLVWTSKITDGGAISLSLPTHPARAGLYEDVAVIAYPSLPAELVDAALKPAITSSDPAFDAAFATDKNPDTMAQLSVGKEQPGWIQFSYDKPVTIRSAMVENATTRDLAFALEKSDNGEQWEAVTAFELRRLGKTEYLIDETFAPVTARYFRITSPRDASFGDMALSALGRIKNSAGHTNMTRTSGAQLPLELDAVPGMVIDPSQIVDLTGAMDANGKLTATLGDGQWTILRFGYTSTAALNVNPSPEGEGLEVDKFSSAAFMAHYNAFIGPVIARAHAAAPNAMSGVMIDSYEVGGQNWTAGYEDLFAQRFGKSLLPWLPVYAGRMVSSAAETRALLADIRSFNASLIRDNYYGAFADVLKLQGLDSLIQPYGFGPFDDVEVGAVASVPTGEFWMGRPATVLSQAVSAGRLYQSGIIAAEAFTSEPQVNWKFSPALGKKWGDRAWTQGVNQFMFHRFAHQANTHVMPGMTMNRWGSHFDRTQPWWDAGGKAWFEYMARGHYLLRQGVPVVDIALYVGNDSPVICPSKADYADRLPAGVEYDCLNTETLLSRSRFVDGQLELPNGARYAMIWWPQDRLPDAAALARLQEARAAGVPVAMAHAGDDVSQVFAQAGLSPRILSSGELPLFTQRRVGQADVFFLLNFEEQEAQYDLAFAARGHAPQLWNPVTGEITALPAQMDADGRTRVQLSLLPSESTFVVFDPANALIAPAPVSTEAAQQLAGPWSITFDPVYSDAGTITVPGLFDLSTSDDDEIRHFSGKADYRTSFTWNDAAIPDGAKVMLDLGRVEVAATVRLNGVDLGTVWTAPYAVDVSKAIRKGENVLEVHVANLWVNRLIGDAGLENTSGFTPSARVPTENMIEWYSANQPQPAGPRRTFTTQDFYRAGDPLVASGLIGPVQLVIETVAD